MTFSPIAPISLSPVMSMSSIGVLRQHSDTLSSDVIVNSISRGEYTCVPSVVCGIEFGCGVRDVQSWSH